MVHAVSGLILVLTFCIFPCAANTKLRLNDVRAHNKVQPEEPAEPVKAAEAMDRGPEIENINVNIPQAAVVIVVDEIISEGFAEGKIVNVQAPKEDTQTSSQSESNGATTELLPASQVTEVPQKEFEL